MTAIDDVVLEAHGISKSFPGVKALDGVDLTLRAGRSTALLGENGAGKSTLMKILAGVQSPDSGKLIVEGRPVSFNNPRPAIIRTMSSWVSLCSSSQPIMQPSRMTTTSSVTWPSSSSR